MLHGSISCRDIIPGKIQTVRQKIRERSERSRAKRAKTQAQKSERGEHVANEVSENTDRKVHVENRKYVSEANGREQSERKHRHRKVSEANTSRTK